MAPSVKAALVAAVLVTVQALVRVLVLALVAMAVVQLVGVGVEVCSLLAPPPLALLPLERRASPHKLDML